jgi:hypothetical protein
MSRTSMAVLITRVRFMVGDPLIAGTPVTSTFTDDQIQDALDHHRTDVIQLRLIPRATLTTTGAQWKDYQAPCGFWEDDVVIVDPTFNAVTPATSDELTGHWTFTVSTLPNLYITGKAYDMYGAAAEILEAWSGIVRAEGDFDFSEDGQSFSRSQKGRGLDAQAAEYRRKALPAGPRFAGIGSDPREIGVGP